MIKKNILFLSAFFPNPSATSIAPYNKQILLSLSDYYNIDAVVPVPWPKRLNNHSIPYKRTEGTINIYHPTYYYTPFIMRHLYGKFYYFSVCNTIRTLVKDKKYDLLYTSWLYPDAWVASSFAKYLKIPLFASVLGTDVNRLKPDSIITNKSLEVAHSADKLICVCNVLKQKLMALGCPSEKLIYLQNGVDQNIFYPRDKNEVRINLGIDPDTKLLIYVGNLIKEKGISELVESFNNISKKKLFHNLKLVIIGNGRYRPKLINKLKQYNLLGSTLLLGVQPLDVIASWMNASDVLCLPSYSEGQPNVVIEALTCQTKVVATNVGGIPDLDDGYGSMKLVSPKSVDELSNALVEMINKRRADFTHNSIHSWKDYTFRLMEIFEHKII